MRRAMNMAERQRHDGRCSSAGGPVVVVNQTARPIDDREVELAIRSLRARIHGETK